VRRPLTLTSHVFVARMGGSGPALPARGPALAPLTLTSHVPVARMGGSGPALPARGPALAPLIPRRA